MRLRTTLALVMLAAAAMGGGQFGQKIPGLKIPGLDSDPLQKQPITTSLKDAKWEDADHDGFMPRDPERSLSVLMRTPDGGFTLQPGYYTLTLQSY